MRQDATGRDGRGSKEWKWARWGRMVWEDGKAQDQRDGYGRDGTCRESNQGCDKTGQDLMRRDRMGWRRTRQEEMGRKLSSKLRTILQQSYDSITMKGNNVFS